MDTWGDIITRNFQGGQAIGDKVSTWRFNRGVDQIKQQAAAEAQQQGITLDAYLNQRPDGATQSRYADIEDKINALASSSGVSRRGITAPGGGSMASSALGDMDSLYTRKNNRTASQSAINGNFAGAENTAAIGSGQVGDLAGAEKHTINRMGINDTNNAIGADGQVNLSQAYQNRSITSARTGDLAGADQNHQLARATSLQIAAQQSGVLMTMAANPTLYDGEQQAGHLTALMGNVPELGSGLNARVAKDGDVWIMRGDQQLLNYSKMDSKEKLNMLHSFMTDPAGTVPTLVGLLKQNADELQKHEFELDTKSRDKMAEIVANYANNKDATTAIMSISAASAAAEKAGWKVTPSTAGDGSMTTLESPSHKLYIMHMGAVTDPKTGLTTAAQITDAQNNPVPQSELDADSTLQAYSKSVVDGQTAMAKMLDANDRQKLMLSLQLIPQIYGKIATVGGDSGASAGKLGAPSPEVAKMLDAAAAKYKVPREYAYAIADGESSFDPKAKGKMVNGEQAQGIMQWMPSSAKAYGVTLGDTQSEIDGAMRRFATNMKAHGPEFAMAAHYAGEQGALDHLGKPTGNAAQTTADGSVMPSVNGYSSDYIKKAAAWKAKLEGGASDAPALATDPGTPGTPSTADAAPADAGAAPKQAIPTAKADAPKPPPILAQDKVLLWAYRAHKNRILQQIKEFDDNEQPQATMARAAIGRAPIPTTRQLNPQQQAVRDGLQRELDAVNHGLDQLASNAAKTNIDQSAQKETERLSKYSTGPGIPDLLKQLGVNPK
jgi:hypothetical protein